jgi:predicted dehydrogenase
MSTIAIIGAGAIGSRHLQALSRLREPSEIWIVDPSHGARATARARWDEVAAESSHRVNEVNSMEVLPADLDVAVVATTSSARRDVVETLLDSTRVRHLILEKFLFPRDADYDAVARCLADARTSAWVNCPRRLWPAWRVAATRLKDTGPLSCRVTASTRSPLGSNAIHWLDLLARLDPSQRFELRGDRLELDRHASRHADHIEFTGTLYGFGDAGGTFEYTVYPTDSGPMLTEIFSPRARLIVREFDQRAWLAAEDADWTWCDLEFPLVFQSAITDVAVADLVAHDRCDLTPFDESSCLHRKLLNVFLGCYRAETGEDTDTCPIT